MSDFQTAQNSVLSTITQLDAQDNSGQAVPQVPVSGAENQAPIALQGDELEEFKNDFLYELNLSRGRSITDEDVKRWRDYYNLRKPTAPYAGAPTHTLPIVRGKVRGFVSHAWRSLNRDPFYVMRTYTEAAGDARNALETAMEREIDKVRGQRQYKLALKETALTGTCFLGASVAPDPNDDTQYVFPIKAYRLENVYVSPTGTEDLRNCSTFVRTEMPKSVINDFRDKGFFDPDAVKRLNNPNAYEAIAREQQQDGNREYLSPESDNSTYEIYECYFRWHGLMYHVYFSYSDQVLLHLQRSPYSDAIGEMPPYWPIRMDPDLNYIYGTGIAHATEAAQDISDFAFNAHEALMQYAISPIIFVQEDSEAFAVLADEGPVPGGIYGTASNPKDAVYPLQIPESKSALTEISLAKQVADGATFYDNYFTGEPLNNVRSATEVSSVMNASTTLLSDYMSSIAYDFAQFGAMLWALIYKFKIEPNGVIDVTGGDGEYLIAKTDISEQEYAQRLIEFAIQHGIDPVTAQQMVVQYQQQRHEFVPGAKRDDYEWVANGAELIADKQQRARMYERLFSEFPMFQAASQDYRAWNLLKDYLESLDVSSWRKYLGPEPSNKTMDMESMMQVAQSIQMMKQGGGGQR